MYKSSDLIQEYFKSISADDVNRKLSYLKKVLPRKCTKRNYQLAKKHLTIRTNVKEKELQSNLQLVADKMRVHLQINRHIKILTMSNVAAGKFERIDGLNCIYINGSLKNQNYKQKLAILAHEMSHYYLIYKHNIYIDDNDENELLTELNAIFVGFGFLLFDGYRILEKHVGNKRYVSRVGYIKEETIKQAIVKTAYLRKQNPIWIVKNTIFGNFFYFSYNLSGLIKEYYKGKFSKLKSRKI